MDFFNKLSQKAKETYEGASKKTGELAREAKLRMKMNENKSLINSLYKEIGKKVYEKHVIAESVDIKTDLEEECTQIDILSAEIETCLNEIRELKDKKQCPNCYNEIELEANYCSYCGAKQDVREAREVEVVDSTSDEAEVKEEIIDTINEEKAGEEQEDQDVNSESNTETNE